MMVINKKIRKTWNKQEDDFVKLNYTALTDKQIAEILNRTERSVQTRRVRFLKLSETKFIIAQKVKKNGTCSKEKNGNWKGGISKNPITNKPNNIKYRKMQKQKWPEKEKARKITTKYIRNGKLIRGICQNCKDKSKKVHAHHNDYSKPLEITWLCRECHDKEHKRLKNMRD
jgi:hypothetical protein